MQTPSSSLRILVADDSLLQRRVLSALLESEGHVVTLAKNGREAVEKLREKVFDLVFMDVEMPEMDGLEATRLIRESERTTRVRVPIVAVTTTVDRDICLQAGMDHFLAKPPQADALRETIRCLA